MDHSAVTKKLEIYEEILEYLTSLLEFMQAYKFPIDDCINRFRARWLRYDRYGSAAEEKWAAEPRNWPYQLAGISKAQVPSFVCIMVEVSGDEVAALRKQARTINDNKLDMDLSGVQNRFLHLEYTARGKLAWIDSDRSCQYYIRQLLK